MTKHRPDAGARPARGGASVLNLAPKCRLAVAAMMDLALQQHLGPVPLAAISARQQVSPSYLDLLFARLRRAGLVLGMRGPGGGYTLARAADAITLADIVRAVDDASPNRAPMHRSFADRPHAGPGISSHWVDDLERQLVQLLAQTTLEDAVAPHKQQAPAGPVRSHPTAKGVGERERMVVVAANSVFARPMRLAI